MHKIKSCTICKSVEQKIIYNSTLNDTSFLEEIPNPYHYQINECVNCNLRFSSPIFENDLIHRLYSYSDKGSIVYGEELNVKKTMFNYYKLVKPCIALLIKAKSELNKGGIIFSVVHNSKLILGVLLGGKFPVYNLYHHYLFSKKTLSDLFELKVYKVISISNYYSISFFVGKIPFYPILIKKNINKLLEILGIDKLALNVPIGDIGIIAKKI
jgi:hypothetical protein